MGGSRASARLIVALALIAGCKKGKPEQPRPREIVAVDEHHALVLDGLGDEPGRAWLVDDTGKTTWSRRLPGGPQGRAVQVGVFDGVLAVPVRTRDQLVELVGLDARTGAQRFRTPVDLLDEWHDELGVHATPNGFFTASDTAVATVWPHGVAGDRWPSGGRTRSARDVLITESKGHVSIRPLGSGIGVYHDDDSIGPGCVQAETYVYLSIHETSVIAKAHGTARHGDEPASFEVKPIELPFPAVEGWTPPENIEVEACGTRGELSIFLISHNFDLLLVAIDPELDVRWSLALPSASIRGNVFGRDPDAKDLDGELPRHVALLLQPYVQEHFDGTAPAELVIADLDTRGPPQRRPLPAGSAYWSMFQAGSWFVLSDDGTGGVAAFDGETGTITGVVSLPAYERPRRAHVAGDRLWALAKLADRVSFAAVDLRTMTELHDPDGLVGDAPAELAALRP